MYWVCTVKTCHGRGILNKAEFRVTYPEHNHKPCEDGKFDEIEKLNKLKKLVLKSNKRGTDLLEVLGIEKDREKYLKAIRSWRSRQRKKTWPKPVTIPVGLNYKILRMGRSRMISHSGFVYRLDQTTESNETGSSRVKYWRCRSAYCRGRAKMDESGNLFIVNPSHNHLPEAPNLGKRGPRRIAVGQSGNSQSPQLVKPKIEETSSILENLDSFPAGNSASNFALCFSAAEADTYRIEKLMADNMQEDYGVTPTELQTFNLNPTVK